jgi:hypothetical protein
LCFPDIKLESFTSFSGTEKLGNNVDIHPEKDKRVVADLILEYISTSTF